MKFISIILITVVVFSSVFPCVDAENISLKDNNLISLTTERDHSDTEDNCSPFCVCACCSISLSLEFSISSYGYIPSINSVIQLQDNYIFNPLLSIWQPPKV